MLINTTRCSLRPFTLNDIDDLYRLHSHPQVMQHIPCGIRTKEETLIDIHEDIEHQQQHGFSKWAVSCRKTGMFIGRAGLAVYEPTGEVEVGYKFFPEYWGKGYATEVLEGILQWGFAHLTVDTIIGFAYPDNIASVRVMEKVGMKYLRNDMYEGRKVVVYGR